MRIDRYSQRLEKRLSNFAIEMLNKRCTLNKKGSLSQREDFKNTPKKISVLQSEIITVDEWEKQIDVLKGNLDTARSEMSQWKEKDKKLEEEEALFKELINEKKNAEVVSEEKDSMKKYIRQLEREELTSANYTPLPHLKTRQAQNKRLKQLKTRAQKALYFMSLFGLELDFLKVKDPNSPKKYTIDFKSSSASRSLQFPQSQPHESPLQSQPHESPQSQSHSTQSPQLQSSARIAKLNSLCSIRSTPGKAPGAQHSFKELLIEQIKELVSYH